MQSILQKSYSGMIDSPGKINVIDSEMVAETVVSPDQMPDHLKNALTRDYSSLMGAIDKKKNGVK